MRFFHPQKHNSKERVAGAHVAPVNIRKNTGPALRHHRLARRQRRYRGRFRHLVGEHGEILQPVPAERGRDRDVGGIAAARDHDAPDARHLVARVERVPASTPSSDTPKQGGVSKAVSSTGC